MVLIIYVYISKCQNTCLASGQSPLYIYIVNTVYILSHIILRVTAIESTQDIAQLLYVIYNLHDQNEYKMCQRYFCVCIADCTMYYVRTVTVGCILYR